MKQEDIDQRKTARIQSEVTQMRTLAALSVYLMLISACAAQTLVGDGAVDNTPIWNQIVTTTCASADREVRIPMGNFRFAEAMQPIPCSLHVRGEGPGISVFKFDYTDTGGSGYYVTGGIDPYGGGSLRDVSLVVTSGNTVGIALHIHAHLETDPNVASHNPHGFFAENILIGRDAAPPFTGSFNYGVYLDGADNASPPAGVAPGMRYVRVSHVSVASFNILPALAYYAYGSRFIDFDCYVGNGSASYNVEGLNDQNTTFALSQTCAYLHAGN